jgi:hypothetical protein
MMFIWIIISIFVALVAIVLLYFLVLRPWHKNWGANDKEIKRQMLGDDLVENPLDITTRAITIKAKPEDIWPWFVQMGYKRGGMYSYDQIDRLLGILDSPSAERIIPEFQHLEVGDVIPLGKPPNWPVKAITPNKSLLLDIRDKGIHITWSFLLEELDEEHTRFVLRIRQYMANRLLLILIFPIADFGSFLMTRKFLLGIKRRAEKNT